MPFTDLGDEKGSEFGDGDGRLSFEMPGFKRNISFTEFPLRIAICCTVHNAQGLNFQAVAVARMRNSGNQAESIYVALSREQSIEIKFLLEGILDEDIARFSRGPAKELDEELERLRNIENDTIEDLCRAFQDDSKLQSAQDEIRYSQSKEKVQYRLRTEERALLNGLVAQIHSFSGSFLGQRTLGSSKSSL